jgi:hypothetical protein
VKSPLAHGFESHPALIKLIFQYRVQYFHILAKNANINLIHIFKQLVTISNESKSFTFKNNLEYNRIKQVLRSIPI